MKRDGRRWAIGENPVMATSGRSPGGLRERKKLKTRNAIQREAMRMFQEQGYEETTIEQIAEAVEISPSTFFNYFRTKEDVVFYDPYDPLFISMFMARPSDEPLGVAIRRTVSEGLGAILKADQDLIRTRGKLMMEVPALRARVWEELERTQDLFCGVLAERTGRDPFDLELRVVTMMMIAAVYTAGIEWMRGGASADLLEIYNRALDIAEAGVRLDSIGHDAARAAPGAIPPGTAEPGA